MRIISAHYAWNGEKGFVKNPLLYLNDHHEVERLVEQGSVYKEQAGTEFYSGIIVPGFLSCVALDESTSEKQFNKKLDEYYAVGSLFVAVDEVFFQKFKVGDRNMPILFPLNRNEMLENLIDHFSNQSTWSRMKTNVIENKENRIANLLNHNVLELFKLCDLYHVGGSFQVGKKPGVLLITGINWSDMTFNRNMSLKIIDIPD